MSSLMSSEITSWKVRRDQILLFYSPQSHLISRLLIFFFSYAGYLKDLKYHLSDSYPWLPELSQGVTIGPEKTKPLQKIFSTGKEKQNYFYASFGMENLWDLRPKPLGWNKMVPLQNTGQTGVGFWKDHKVIMQQEGVISFFLFLVFFFVVVVVFWGFLVFCYPPAIKKSSWKWGRTTERLGQPREASGRRVASPSFSCPQVVGWSHELIEYHDGQIHKNIPFTDSPEVCENFKFSLEV